MIPLKKPKVFWFFFSKKNDLFFCLCPDCRAAAGGE